MIKFRKLIEQAKTQGAIAGDGASISFKEFKELLNNSQSFVIEPSGDETKDLEEKNEYELPFARCSFEMSGDTLLSVHESGACIECAFFTDELNFFLGLLNNEPLVFFSKNDFHFRNAMAEIVNAKNIVVGKDKVGPRGFSFGSSRYFSFKPVIYIARTKHLELAPQKVNRQKIDWSHRFWVRGHYRKIEGVGKNRDGEYCLTGKTWVREHEKGEGELIDKVRIIKNDSTA